MGRGLKWIQAVIVDLIVRMLAHWSLVDAYMRVVT